MKKLILTFVILSLHLMSYSLDVYDPFVKNDTEFESLIKKGKEVFSKEYDEQDYKVAVENFEKAVRLEPDNTEALYFLGYAYDRLNSKHGGDSDKINISLTKKSSEQFEKVIKLTPKYEGEELVLDPYSKLSSIWGAQALCYMADNKSDSVIWACQEGRERGGFSDYWLCVNRKILDNCPDNALLFVTGDMQAFHLLYLQQKEKYRTDVAMIILPFFNTDWYPKMMEESRIIDFGITQSERDSLDYCYTNEDVFSISFGKNEKFLWVPTGYSKDYLLRGDRLFLELLENNKFKREVFFTVGTDPSSLIGLDEHLENYTNVSRLNYDNASPVSRIEYEKMLMKNLECLEYLNENSTQEVSDIQRTRYYVLDKTQKYFENDQTEDGKYMLHLFDKYLISDKYTRLSYHEEEYYEHLKEQLYK